jgi:hypothetical protein
MSELNVGKVRASAGVVIPTFDNATLPASPELGQIVFNSEEEIPQLWNGTEWIGLGGGNKLDGSTAEKAALSAADIKIINPAAPDGVYWINLPSVGPKQIYCIMDSSYDGGGWMMAMKATRGTTFNYESSYWTSTNTLNVGSTNTSDGDAKFDTFNHFAAKDLLAVWPDLTANSGCFNVPRGHIWLENNFWQGGTRSTLTTVFSTADRYFIRDANNFCGINQFSRQTDVRFYGINYRNDPGWGRTRWGFGWNENGGGLFPNGNMGSDDVSGGIGMMPNFQSYSAGDRINCCQNVTGFNRSARVEVYVR